MGECGINAEIPDNSEYRTVEPSSSCTCVLSVGEGYVPRYSSGDWCVGGDVEGVVLSVGASAGTSLYAIPA